MKHSTRILNSSILCILFAAGPFSWATTQELFEINNSVRALGMGNAYVSTVDNHEALFYNPAGLSKVDSVRVTIMGLQLGANGGDVAQAYQDFQSSNSFSNKIQNLYGRKIWAGGGARAAIVAPNFGFMIYNNSDVFLRPQNPAAPNLSYNLINDFGFAAGYSYSLDWFSIGLTAKRISRYGGRGEVGPSTLASLDVDEIKRQVENRGSGISTDLGISARPPGLLKPTFSFVIRNFGLTQFAQESGANRVPDEQPEWIAGMSFELDAGLAVIRPELDVKWANRNSVPIGKRLHAGVEVDLPLIDLRGGFNSGYYTLGVGANLGVLRVDAATYGVELGAYPGQQEDRRYIAQFRFEIDFGSALGSSSKSTSSSSTSGGPRSRLKPRR